MPHRACNDPSANTQLQVVCGWGEAGIAPRGSIQLRGLFRLEEMLWMEQQPGQTSRTSGGLVCPWVLPSLLAAGLREQPRGAQRVLRDLERPTHHTDNPSIFPSPVHHLPRTDQARRNSLAGG